MSAVLRKLQLSNRHELSRWAVERGWLDYRLTRTTSYGVVGVGGVLKRALTAHRKPPFDRDRRRDVEVGVGQIALDLAPAQAVA